MLVAIASGSFRINRIKQKVSSAGQQSGHQRLEHLRTDFMDPIDQNQDVNLRHGYGCEITMYECDLSSMKKACSTNGSFVHVVTVALRRGNKGQNVAQTTSHLHHT